MTSTCKNNYLNIKVSNDTGEVEMPYEIEYQEGHVNSKGKPAPWVIINKDRNEIVGSSVTQEKAESAVRARLAGEHGFVKSKKG